MLVAGSATNATTPGATFTAGPAPVSTVTTPDPMVGLPPRGSG